MSFNLLCDRCGRYLKTMTALQVQSMSRMDNVICDECEDAAKNLKALIAKMQASVNAQVKQIVDKFDEQLTAELQELVKKNKELRNGKDGE